MGYGWVYIKHAFTNTYQGVPTQFTLEGSSPESLGGKRVFTCACGGRLRGLGRCGWVGRKDGENVLTTQTFQILVVEVKLEGAIPSQDCMTTSSRNNQSEQGEC